MSKWLSFVLVVCWARAQSPSVKALLIANSNYPQLSAPAPAGSNAELVAAALREIGARPRLEQNLGNDDLSRIIENEFLPSVQPGDVVVFYFGGRAIQIDQDVQRANYLLPSDFAPQSPGPLRDRAYAVNRAQTLLEDRKPSLILFVLDAAYTDPRLENVRGFLPGLAESRDVPNSIIIYSSAKDQPLPSGLSTVFGAKLAELIKRPGIEMLTLAGELKTSTQLATAGAQNPYVLPVYPGTFKFVPPKPREPSKTETKIIFVDQQKVHHRSREPYVLIPAGTFKMGCVPASEKDCEPQEKPQHEVQISRPFWIGVHEVTVDSFKKFAKKLPGSPAGRNFKNETDSPMVMVSWEDAVEYCSWTGGRLPTEAEWEYAARGGKQDQAFPMSSFENARDAANFKGKHGNDNYDYVAPVGKFDKNPFGLFDMAGNVWEWVNDFFSETYYSEIGTALAKDPGGPPSGNEHVTRGGSFESDPREHLRLSYRFRPKVKSDGKTGFRCMLPDAPEVRSQLQ